MTRSQLNSAIFFLASFIFTTFVHGANWSSSNSTDRNRDYTAAQKEIRDQNYQQAIDHLEKTIKVESDNADAYNLLGYSNRKLKRFEQAEKFYLQALTLDPEHQGALEYLGELYVETKRLDKAKEMLARLDDACFLFCSEYRQLKSKIEAYESPKAALNQDAQDGQDKQNDDYANEQSETYSMGYYSIH